MITSSLDTICKSILLRKRVGLHYYLDVLIAARDILRDLTLDENISVLRTQKLPVTDYNAVTIPSGAASIISVSLSVGQQVRMLTEDNSISSLHNYDGSFVPQRINGDAVCFNGVAGWWNAASYNDFGENMGRQFGYGAGNPTDTYKVIPERNEIQLNQRLNVDSIIVTFIGDGQDVDAATHIDVEAVSCIESYILWQLSEMSRSYSTGDKERLRLLYVAERKKLRARKSDLTIQTLRRIVQKNTRGSIK